MEDLQFIMFHESSLKFLAEAYLLCAKRLINKQAHKICKRKINHDLVGERNELPNWKTPEESNLANLLVFDSKSIIQIVTQPVGASYNVLTIVTIREDKEGRQE